MIRQIKHLGKDYFIVYTKIVIDENNIKIDTPMQIQVCIDNIDEKKHFLIYKKLEGIFGHGLILLKKPTPQSNKKWWKFW